MGNSKYKNHPVPQITSKHLRAELRRHADKKQAALLQRFFKTGPGDYGEGDIFIGVMVPQTRSVVRACKNAPVSAIKKLLKSPVHEERLLALMLLVEQYAKGDEKERELIFTAYLKHTRFINNWDLVDLSAPQIVGRHLAERDRSILYRLARSRSLWERRVSILAAFWFIKTGDFGDAFSIAEMLLKDSHDLIHKAVGWMLREIGKRDIASEEAFLRPRYKAMPRTMLRYAIERFPEKKRQAYLKGLI
jgi:3-methyladenine DNA glycosylase AlkD